MGTIENTNILKYYKRVTHTWYNIKNAGVYMWSFFFSFLPVKQYFHISINISTGPNSFLSRRLVCVSICLVRLTFAACIILAISSAQTQLLIRPVNRIIYNENTQTHTNTHTLARNLYIYT